MSEMSDVEKRMQDVEAMQEAWTFVLDCMDGQITEAMRHGWDPSQARLMVYASCLHTTLGGLSTPQPPQS